MTAGAMQMWPWGTPAWLNTGIGAKLLAGASALFLTLYTLPCCSWYALARASLMKTATVKVVVRVPPGSLSVRSRSGPLQACRWEWFRTASGYGTEAFTRLIELAE